VTKLPYEPENIAAYLSSRTQDVGMHTAVLEMREALQKAEWLIGWSYRPSSDDSSINTRNLAKDSSRGTSRYTR